MKMAAVGQDCILASVWAGATVWEDRTAGTAVSKGPLRRYLGKSRVNLEYQMEPAVPAGQR